MHRPTVSIYDDPLLVIDLTKAVRTFFRAGTINAGGTLFGTDKLIHFINVGKIYHAKYQSRVEQGKAEGDGGAGGDPFRRAQSADIRGRHARHVRRPASIPMATSPPTLPA